MIALIRRAWEWLNDLVVCTVAIVLLFTLVIASLRAPGGTDETLGWTVQE